MRAAASLRAGWGAAFAWSLLTLAAVGLLSEAVAFGVWEASAQTAGVLPVAKVAGLLFFWFHRAGLVFELSAARAFATGPTGSFTVAFAPLLGTFGAGALLFAGGRRVVRASRSGTASAPLRTEHALHAAKLSLAYGLVCLAASFGPRLSGLPLGAGGFGARLIGRASIHPSLPGAALWPALLAAVFGVAGGVAVTGARRARAVVSGAAHMLALGLALALAGLLVLAAVHPDRTGAYFRGAFHRGAARGTALIGLHVLVAPNMSAWVLDASMGDCLALRTSQAGGSGCFLSYSRVPSGPGLARSVGIGVGATPPAGAPTPSKAYLLFLMVPALATVLGGRRAAKRAGARTRPDGAATGAAAGVVFAAFAFLLFLGSLIVVAVAGSGPGLTAAVRSTAQLGPRLGVGTVLAAAWGVVGGALGGLTARPPTLELADPAEPIARADPEDDGPS